MGTGALRPLQSTGASPGSEVWRAASVRLCFHSLIPGTQLSSPRPACKEFNTSLGRQKPRAGLHPHGPSCHGPPETQPAPGTVVPLLLINKTQVVLSNKTMVSYEFLQFVLAACLCSLPTTWTGWWQGAGSTDSATLPDAAGVVTGQHNISPANP